MRSVEKSGRSVEDAVAEALRELAVERDRVEVQVLEEGSKGLFGILGGKQARVKVTVKDELQEKLEKGLAFLTGVLERLNVKADVVQRQSEEGSIELEVTGESLGLVIGRRGQMLDSLQYLLNVVANRGEGEWVRFVLDAEGYRQRREEALRSLALRIAERVESQGRRASLEPMNPAERRIVHMALAEATGVKTHSEGDEPYRRIVITPAKG